MNVWICLYTLFTSLAWLYDVYCVAHIYICIHTFTYVQAMRLITYMHLYAYVHISLYMYRFTVYVPIYCTKWIRDLPPHKLYRASYYSHNSTLLTFFILHYSTQGIWGAALCHLHDSALPAVLLDITHTTPHHSHFQNYSTLLIHIISTLLTQYSNFSRCSNTLHYSHYSTLHRGFGEPRSMAWHIYRQTNNSWSYHIRFRRALQRQALRCCWPP